jgi:7-cyano-7-deazaguanine synthase
LQIAINLGMASEISLETPLMWLNKAQTWQLAKDLGGMPFIDLIRDDTHTCYLGERHMHDWGRGCGECPACALRVKGYREFLNTT